MDEKYGYHILGQWDYISMARRRGMKQRSYIVNTSIDSFEKTVCKRLKKWYMTTRAIYVLWSNDIHISLERLWCYLALGVSLDSVISLGKSRSSRC